MTESKILIGLEVHIQLSGGKLFCRCPTEGSISEGSRFERVMSSVTGEMGITDPAVLYERKRARSFTYATSDNSCLVEADEEPPLPVDRDALLRALATSIHMSAIIPERIEFMRKIVVDGSNTSGFQRTAIVSLGGQVNTSSGPVRISSICLEEDSCRKIEQDGSEVLYSLDRLGIPLLEISTEPDIVSPEHAREVAEKIAGPLIASGWVRKGADEIRQDVNFSMGYGRVEIKGVQKLSDIESCIRYEMKRQSALKLVSDRLQNLPPIAISLSDSGPIFKKTASGILKKSVSKGMTIFIARMPGFRGLLRNGEMRLGKELSDIIKSFGGGGLMHSDEMPAYGVEEEISQIRSSLKCQEDDAFLIVTATPDKKGLLETELSERIRRIYAMDLSETRYMNADGTTSFLRPLPGGARMYPETDIPIIEVTGLLDEARNMVPSNMSDMIEGMVKRYGISAQDAETIVKRGLYQTFNSAAQLIGNPSLAVFALIHSSQILSKKGARPLSQEELGLLLESLKGSIKDRESLEQAVLLYSEGKLSLDEIRKYLEDNVLSEDELEEIISDIMDSGHMSERNLIPAIKGQTSKRFSPKSAIEIYRNRSRKG